MKDFATLQIVALADLPDAIAEAASVTNSQVVKRHADAKRAWDYIRVEIWEDSGRVIVFPASNASQKRIDVAGVQIICAELANRIDAISKSGAADDAYDDQVKSEVAGVVATVREMLPRQLGHPVRIFDSFGYEK